MRKILPGLIIAAAAAIIIGCGGSGGGTTFSLATRSIQEMQRQSYLSVAMSGVTSSPFGGFGGGGSNSSTGTTTGGSTGGGGADGFPMMGGFMRNFGGGGTTGGGGFAPAMVARQRSEVGTTGGTDGGTDGGGGGVNDYFYFDEWINLWVQVHYEDFNYSSLFYEDEAKTRPAGHVTSSFTGSFDSYPQTYVSDYEFTAGLWAGSHGHYEDVYTSDWEGHMSYNDTYPDGGHDSGTSSWGEEGTTWEYELHQADGKSYTSAGNWNYDGTAHFSTSNSDGWSADWTYNADWSGEAHFTVPNDPKFPATLTWTADGHYHVVYADGTTEDWTWEDWWGWDGESNTGTTGTTGGVSAPTPAHSSAVDAK